MQNRTSKSKSVIATLKKSKKDGKMSTLKWFNHLKPIFNSFTSLSINKQAFRASILSKIDSFPLISPQSYKSKISEQGFTLNEIFDRLNLLPDFFIWDQLMRALMENEHKEKPNILKENERTKPLLSNYFEPSENKSQSERKFKYLNLCWSELQFYNGSDLESLVLINLSNNWLESLTLQTPNLVYLNVSNNLLKRIFLPKNGHLQEIYASNNQIDSVNPFCMLDSLILLDLTGNLIELYSELASLSIFKKLMILKLERNPISNSEEYRENIFEIQQKISVLDPSNIEYYSRSKHKNILFCLDIEDGIEVESVQPTPMKPTLPVFSPELTPEHMKESVSMDLSYSTVDNNFFNASLKENEKTPKRRRYLEMPESTRSRNRTRSFGNTGVERPKSAVKRITSSSIHESEKIGFGNAINSMMIKPPQLNRNCK